RLPVVGVQELGGHARDEGVGRAQVGSVEVAEVRERESLGVEVGLVRPFEADVEFQRMGGTARRRLEQQFFRVHGGVYRGHGPYYRAAHGSRNGFPGDKMSRSSCPPGRRAFPIDLPWGLPRIAPPATEQEEFSWA